jgi:hypothetical protein
MIGLKRKTGGSMEGIRQAIKIAVRGAMTVPLAKLEPFQGDLKRLERAEYESLRKGLIDLGFSFTMHIWQHEGHNYIIDGHQRLTALKMMEETENFIIPEIPVSIVDADDFATAKRKVLAGTSQYGIMTEKSLFDFCKVNDIPLDNIVSTFKFQDINMEKFGAMFQINPENLPTAPPQVGVLPSGSEGVRQVQLFFDAKSHEEFLNLVNHLTSIYKTENITDTVLMGMRAALTSHH